MEYRELIRQMTLEEKASLMSGKNFWNTKSIDRLGIPGMMLTDGPHGLRKQGGKADHLGLNKSLPATCFPTAATLANSWDTQLLERVGVSLGKEAAHGGVGVLLGPGLNIKRNPRCGRNFEYFSEDPYLSGKLAAAMIRGIQSNGISACPKHFAVNSQEERRMVIDEVVDERAFREIYLEGFRYAVTEGKANAIMTSYNRINGTYANENKYLLQDILIGEWKYDGLIVTDWGGENDRIKGLEAGNQLEMPSSAGITDAEIVAAVKNKTLSEELLDERVNSLLKTVFKVHKERKTEKNFTYKNHHKMARDAARQSIVLLKNKNQILPLDQKKTISIIGDFAKQPRYQGAGSSLINPTALDNAVSQFEKAGYPILGYEAGFDRLRAKDNSKLKKAVDLAKKSEICILFLGLDEGREAEGIDRLDLKLAQNQIILLKQIRKVCKQVIVVVSGGAPIETSWAKQTDAILLAYLGGQAGAGAVVDILTGKYNPSAKLAETYPIKGEDIPFNSEFPAKQNVSLHKESIYIGYRYYDTANKEVAWPFGYGLSYTSFAYKDIKATQNEVFVTVQNIGEITGAEIVQIYIRKKDSAVFMPQKELKGFAKVWLEPNEEKQVKILLNDHAFRYFNTIINEWTCEGGEYEIMAGASSRDIRLTASISCTEEHAPNPYQRKEISPYFGAKLSALEDKEFEQLLGHPLPSDVLDRTKKLDYDDTLEQCRYKKGVGRGIYNLLMTVRKICLLCKKPILANNVMFVLNLSFRQVARLSAGKISMKTLDKMLSIINRN